MTRYSHKQWLITEIEENYDDFTSKELERLTGEQLDYLLSYLENKESNQFGPVLSRMEKKSLLRKLRARDFEYLTYRMVDHTFFDGDD